MEYAYCDQFGFSHDVIHARLKLLELDNEDKVLTKLLHDQVIRPNVAEIVNQFYENYLLLHDDYKVIIGTPDRITPLKKSQAEYLLTLGVDFDSQEYFEKRLRVGIAHDRVGLTLSLYECSYYKLRSLIYKYIETLDDINLARELMNVTGKIISLDMSLAIESYHLGKASKLESSVKDLQGQQVELQKKADTDYLTHFSTREVILAKLDSELSALKQGGYPFSVMMIDLDSLGTINDQFGHLIGDHAMREIASCIQKMVLKNDVVGRYGGDEFLILLPSMDKQQAIKFAEQMRENISHHDLHLKNKSVRLTASIGICAANPADTLAGLVAKVDKALFSAKKNGGNKVVLSNE